MQRRFKIFLALMTLTVSMLAVGCVEVQEVGGGGSTSNPSANFADTFNPQDNWLIYWYICGSNLESGNGAATNDLNEMLQAKLPANVKVLIEAGGSNQWHNALMRSGETNLYLYDSEGLREIATAAYSDMGDAETLATFLQYGKEKFPADHKVFIFWDHGGGSVVGLCQDERTGDILTLNEVRDAFAAVYDANEQNPPFEVVGFDTCLMATYEMANDLYGFAHYMVASEEVEPGNGWEYTSWLKALGENPAMSGAKIGQIICDSYYRGCESTWTESTVTLSVVDLTKLPNLRTAYENFGIEALRLSAQNPRQFFTSLGRSAKYSENYGGNNRGQGYYDMVDIGDLARNAQDLMPQSSKTLIRAIDDAVVHKVNGPYRSKSSGLSSYYPYDGSEAMFDMYANVTAAPDAQKYLYNHLIYGRIPAAAQPLMQGTDLQSLPQPLGGHIFNIAELDDIKIQVDKKNNAFVQLTDEQLSNISSIRCNLAYLDAAEDIILYLGSDANVKVDWKKGTITDNFDATWMMLDGHPVYIEVTAVEKDYNLYAIPIKLNGKRVNLEAAYDFKTNQYKILGARGIETGGMADKNLIKIKAGDKITTLHYGMTVSGADTDLTEVEVDTFTATDKTNLRDERLGDGEYLYCFEFVTPNNESVLSQFINFTVENNTITTNELDY